MRAPRDRGAVAVEFALVVPLLIALLFAVVEGGTRYAQQHQVDHWAFLTARDLSIDPTNHATTVVDALKGSDTTSYSVSASLAGYCSSPSTSAVTVTVSATHSSLTGLFGSYTIKGKGVARCEN